MGIELIGPSLGALQAAGAVPTLVRKTVTFAAGTTGAVGAHDLFTVTGTVLVHEFTAVCGTTLDDTSGATATIQFGFTGATSSLSDGGVISTTADQITAGQAWGTGDADFSDPAPNGLLPFVALANIVYEVAGQAITAGVITFYVTYVPLSAGASVVAA